MIGEDKIRACYWGIALGDALGMPVEFMKIEDIWMHYGMNGIQDIPQHAKWTDDTEMTIAVTRALIRMGIPHQIHDIIQSAPEIFAEEFIKWLDHPGIAPGITCKSSAEYLKRNGASAWQQSGQNDSRGCGAVMRVAPVAMWFHDNDEIRDNIASIQAEITHGKSTASSVSGALAISLAFNELAISDIIYHVINNSNDHHFIGVMDRLQEAMNTSFSMEVKGMQHIGEGWVGDEALAMALYAVYTHPEDFKKCVCMAVNHDGDSDSVGCIAGALMGAMHGIDIIPRQWIQKLSERERLASLIKNVLNVLC